MLLFLAKQCPLFLGSSGGLYSKISKDAFSWPSVGEWGSRIAVKLPCLSGYSWRCAKIRIEISTYSLPGEVEKNKAKTNERGTGTIKVTFIEISIQTKFDDGVHPRLLSHIHWLHLQSRKQMVLPSTNSHTSMWSKRRDTQSGTKLLNIMVLPGFDLTGDGENLTLEGQLLDQKKLAKSREYCGEESPFPVRRFKQKNTLPTSVTTSNGEATYGVEGTANWE